MVIDLGWKDIPHDRSTSAIMEIKPRAPKKKRRKKYYFSKNSLFWRSMFQLLMFTKKHNSVRIQAQSRVITKRITLALVTICFKLTFRWLTQVSTSEILLTNLCRRHCHAASNSCEKWKSESVKILCILRDLVTNPEWKYLQLPTQKYQKDVWRGEGPSRVFHRFADLPENLDSG